MFNILELFLFLKCFPSSGDVSVYMYIKGVEPSSLQVKLVGIKSFVKVVC